MYYIIFGNTYRTIWKTGTVMIRRKGNYCYENKVRAKIILERIDGVDKYVCFKIARFFHSTKRWEKKRGNSKTIIYLDSIESFLYCLSSNNDRACSSNFSFCGQISDFQGESEGILLFFKFKKLIWVISIFIFDCQKISYRDCCFW